MGWNVPRLTRRTYLKNPAGSTGLALRSRFNIIQSQAAADTRVGLESSHRTCNFRTSPCNCKVACKHQDGQLPAVTTPAPVPVASYLLRYDFMNGGDDTQPW